MFLADSVPFMERNIPSFELVSECEVLVVKFVEKRRPGFSSLEKRSWQRSRSLNCLHFRDRT